MTLATAIIAGLVCGYFFGWHQKAGLVFVPVWLAVLVFQTAVVLDDDVVPPEDWAYVPVQLMIFLLGVAMIRLGAWFRARFGGRLGSN